MCSVTILPILYYDFNEKNEKKKIKIKMRKYEYYVDDNKKVYLVWKMEEDNRKKNKYFEIPEIRILTETLLQKCIYKITIVTHD